jgi:hypothetical protein
LNDFGFKIERILRDGSLVAGAAWSVEVTVAELDCFSCYCYDPDELMGLDLLETEWLYYSKVSK